MVSEQKLCENTFLAHFLPTQTHKKHLPIKQKSTTIDQNQHLSGFLFFNPRNRQVWRPFLPERFRQPKGISEKLVVEKTHLDSCYTHFKDSDSGRRFFLSWNNCFEVCL